MTKHACNSETDIKRLARLWIIIPCYNEEVVLPQTAPMFLKKLKSLITDNKIDDSSRILFVNDGSTDRTWDLITAFARADTHYTGIAQSRNRGHQNALVAGMMEAIDHCDMVVTIDCCILSIGNPQNCHQNSLFLEREFLVVVRTRFLHSGVLSGASMHAASDNFSRRT